MQLLGPAKRLNSTPILLPRDHWTEIQTDRTQGAAMLNDFQSFVTTSKVSFWWCHWFQWPPWHGQMSWHESSFNFEDLETKMSSIRPPGPTHHFTQKMHPWIISISKVFGASNDRPSDGTLFVKLFASYMNWKTATHVPVVWNTLKPAIANLRRSLILWTELRWWSTFPIRRAQVLTLSRTCLNCRQGLARTSRWYVLWTCVSWPSGQHGYTWR
jgi:hypothetical protein